MRKPMSFREVRFKLEAAGFRGIVQRGNHAKFVRVAQGVVRTAVLPHYTELAVSTIASILRQAGLSEDEFERL